MSAELLCSEQTVASTGVRGEIVAANERRNAVVTPLDMLNQAVASGANIDVLTKLMDLHERWEAGQARKAFDAAISAAKAEIPTITKNREVDFTSSKGRTNYRHEDLGEIARTVNQILGKHGLSYRFRTTSALNEPISVTCIVSHRQGYSEENTLTGPRDDSGNKNALQQVGSTLTYLQRMTLKAALGLAASQDDDGRAGGGQVDTVSADQVVQLRKLIDDFDVDEAKFCVFLFGKDGGDLESLPAKRFVEASQALNEHGRRSRK